MKYKFIKGRLLRLRLFLLAAFMLMVIVGVFIYTKERFNQDVNFIIINDDLKNEIRISSLDNEIVLKHLPKGEFKIPIVLYKKLVRDDYKVFLNNTEYTADTVVIKGDYINRFETIVIDIKNRNIKLGYISRF
ncbi:hypothetical protein [Chryseobacterium sp.]|uniref:hypothetical protein n=1 Tax=Chryseobacterium sp. TaxID=1871047 RepID=UPI0031E09A37